MKVGQTRPTDDFFAAAAPVCSKFVFSHALRNRIGFSLSLCVASIVSERKSQHLDFNGFFVRLEDLVEPCAILGRGKAEKIRLIIREKSRTRFVKKLSESN